MDKTGLSFQDLKAHTLVLYLFQQNHTYYSKKTTSPNSITPCGPRIQTHDSVGAVLFQPPYSPMSSLFFVFVFEDVSSQIPVPALIPANCYYASFQ